MESPLYFQSLLPLTACSVDHPGACHNYSPLHVCFAYVTAQEPPVITFKCYRSLANFPGPGIKQDSKVHCTTCPHMHAIQTLASRGVSSIETSVNDFRNSQCLKCSSSSGHQYLLSFTWQLLNAKGGCCLTKKMESAAGNHARLQTSA